MKVCGTIGPPGHCSDTFPPVRDKLMGLPTLQMPGAPRLPVLGQGTWRMGEAADRRSAEQDALRFGVAQGLTVIDTAEMYGNGATEALLGDTLADLRDEVFLVSKVYPQNAGGADLKRACENSLRRLRTDRLDLYLLHWRGHVPLEETVAGMRALTREGKIRAWGVSNFDCGDMRDLEATEGVSRDCACNQVLYNLTRRGPEFDLLPWMRARGMPLMAYSPLEQGRLRHRGLDRLAKARGITPLQLALAWVLAQAGVVAIPKAGTRRHVEQNLEAAALTLSQDECTELDKLFPPPSASVPLEML